MITETLREKQSRFVGMVSKFIQFAEQSGYQLTFGEALRSPEEAHRLMLLGKGILNSLHTKKLAVDFNLYKDGVWLTKTEDHKLLGEWWESIGGTWGGRFKDGNHYSLEHDGIR